MEQNKSVVIPVTLKGVNYLLWSRLTKNALGGREEDKWAQEDLMVLSVMLSSLDGPIMEAYSYCETAKQLWDTLQKVYGNVSNLSRVFQVKKAISCLNQEDMDFNHHFGKFRALWAELEMLRPSTTDPIALEERREQDKVFALLLTLNSSYNDLIKHMLRQRNSLPLMMPPSRFNQGRANEAAQYSDQQVAQPMRPNGEGRAMISNAHDVGASSQHVQDDSLIRKSDIEALIKALNANSGNISSNTLHTSLNAKPLIIDSGASHHMIKDSSLISNVEPALGSVVIANGDRIPIKGVGNLKLFGKESKAFYMPSFTSNLLSVKKAIIDLNCNVILSPNDVHFQDIETSKMLGNGVSKGGLYLLEDTKLSSDSPYAFSSAPVLSSDIAVKLVSLADIARLSLLNLLPSMNIALI
ncbi:hypothetical protein N665_1648s0001 [Sinapis alba]|nr:hypothetical protein N665_1648s0001 [Sinapis alba]